MEARFERDTLRWVKRELDATLGQARQALEAYIEDPGDTTQLGFCATHLHQVHGTLRMVELYGAAMLAEEMERLARAVLEGQVGQTDQAYEVLVRAILQLPDYLERLQRGERDIPLVLLPLLNDLRAARGEKLLSESALFSPDLSVVPPEPAHNEAPLGDEELRRKVRSLRHAYQTGLIGWFRDHDVPASLDKLDRVLDELVGKSAAAPAQRLWWVARAVVDALREGALDSSVSVKLLMGQIDRQMKRLVDQGEDDAFANGPATELTKNLLYYVARARPEKSAQVREVQEAFNLPALLPSEEAIAAARDGLAGPNQALMDNVTGAIKDDLARVKDALDLFKRGSRREVSELEPYRETLRQVGDTLAMLGFGQARQRVVEQGEVLERIVAGELAPDDERLLDMASALLSVEGSLEAAAETGSETAPDASSIESTELRAGELSEAELHSLVDAVAREAVAELGRIKDRISDFLESPDQHADLSELGQHFDRIWGSLQILDLERAGELLQQLWTYVDATLVQRGNVPEADALDALAEAVSGIEYFLEATAEGRADRDRIL
ncbi:MAG: Hpt domain-containing protein, partial [Gammaproteobacteria bacterium]|nr:Hpt domain-containing protein [Gammaproteobacteria bacterium]